MVRVILATVVLWLACGVAGVVAMAAPAYSRAQSILIGLAAISGGLGIAALLFAASN